MSTGLRTKFETSDGYFLMPVVRIYGIRDVVDCGKSSIEHYIQFGNRFRLAWACVSHTFPSHTLSYPESYVGTLRTGDPWHREVAREAAIPFVEGRDVVGYYFQYDQVLKALKVADDLLEIALAKYGPVSEV